METQSQFEISYNGRNIKVETNNELEPLFHVHMPGGVVELKLHTDSSGNEHWWQLPFGETPLATQLGEIIECCYIWPQTSKKGKL